MFQKHLNMHRCKNWICLPTTICKSFGFPLKVPMSLSSFSFPLPSTQLLGQSHYHHSHWRLSSFMTDCHLPGWWPPSPNDLQASKVSLFPPIPCTTDSTQLLTKCHCPFLASRWKYKCLSPISASTMGSQSTFLEFSFIMVTWDIPSRSLSSSWLLHLSTLPFSAPNLHVLSEPAPPSQVNIKGHCPQKGGPCPTLRFWTVSLWIFIVQGSVS